VGHSHGTGDEVFEEESNMGFGESTKGFKSDRLHMGLSKEGQ